MELAKLGKASYNKRGCYPDKAYVIKSEGRGFLSSLFRVIFLILGGMDFMLFIAFVYCAKNVLIIASFYKIKRMSVC